MKSTLFLLAFYLQTAFLSAQIWLVDPLEAIYPDANQTTRFSQKWKGDFAQGAIADVHLLVKAPAGETIELSAKLEDELLDHSFWHDLIDVPVEQNTGLDSRTEQFKGDINPHVIRRAPFRIFEVIKPMESNTFKSTENYSAFRLTVPPSVLKKPGTYKIKINLKSENFNQEGTFTIKVYPAQLPDLSKSEFFYTNWFNLTRMEEQHQLERWTDSWFEMLGKYAKMMAHGRQNSITIPGELFKVEGDEIIMDESKMLRFINVFRKYGFKFFEAPHLMNRGENDDWGDPELKVALTKRRYYKENGKEDIEKLMTKIKAFTTANNLTDNWLQHIADEPTAVNAACYKDIVKQAKTIYPEITIMEATNDREGIAGAVDIWCPLINDFQENEAFFREREKLGESVLVYTCLIPGGPWLNRTLDMEKLRQVYFGWGAAFYNTGGYLHWGLNQYYADPFEQSVIHHPSPVAGANNFLPAGDTHIIYPGENGPLSSLRFEAHRIGCEDFDLLQKLKTGNPKLHKKLVTKLFRSYTDYNLNLKEYRKVKKALLKNI
jgi:hypothetical protein